MSKHRTAIIQVSLFVATFITTTLAGSEWVYGRSVMFTPDYSWADFLSGMEFSIPLLLILTVHEFGHYFTAMYHKVKATLPYYIPVPSFLFMLSFGTLGAVIRIKDQVRSNKHHFDIGIAGPLAGFVVALVIVVYGFMTLPPADHIYQFHPEYKEYGLSYADHVYSKEYMEKHKQIDVSIGSTLLFEIIKVFVADKSRIPNAHEIMHYPLLLAGFFSLFVTSLNLLPIGQLDGGHVMYGLLGGKRHKIVAMVFYIAILFYSGLGFIRVGEGQDDYIWMIPLVVGVYFLCMGVVTTANRDRLMYALLIFVAQFLLTWIFPGIKGYEGWFFFVFLISRFVGVEHPPSEIEEPLDSKRIVLGWIAVAIFILCFSPAPITVGG